MRIARLDKAQAGIKIVGRNISNFRYADNTTLMAESKEGIKSFMMKVCGASYNSDSSSVQFSRSVVSNSL